MKTKNVKSLKLVKASIANLEKANLTEIKGGNTYSGCGYETFCERSCYLR